MFGGCGRKDSDVGRDERTTERFPLFGDPASVWNFYPFCCFRLSGFPKVETCRKAGKQYVYLLMCHTM
jgi:hypothetical protein